MKISHKISLTIILLVLITTFLTASIFYIETSTILINNTLDRISTSINNEGLKLKEHISSQRKDTLMLSKIPSINQIDNQGLSSTDWKKNTQELFIALIQANPDYIQIRLINTKGKEVIRVDNIQHAIQIIPDRDLQDKSQSDYVITTLNLSDEEIFLSEINLNRERGKISTPFQAVLRTATPVIDKATNTKTGIIVINAEINHELNKIQSVIQNEGRNIYITNDHGYYLLHPDKDRTFGFDLGKQYRAQEDFPLASKLFKPGNQDSRILLLPDHTQSNNIAIFTKIHFDEINTERFITVGITESYSGILQHETQALYKYLLFSAIIVALSLVSALILSFRLVNPLQKIINALSTFKDNTSTTEILPVNHQDEIGILARTFTRMSEKVKESQNSLNELNNDLENKINERTLALEESKRMLQIVLDTIPVRVFWKDINGKYLGCNTLFANDTGFNDPKLIIGKTDFDMPWKDQAPSYINDDKNVINITAKKLNYEEPQTTPTGDIVWLETNKVALTDASNKIIGILGTYQNITQRKINELKLIESQSRQQAIVQNMIDGVISITPTGIIHSFNKAAEQIFGYTPDEVLGRNVSMLMPEPYHSAHDGYLHNYMTTGKKKIIGIGREVMGLRKDGSTFPLELAVSEVITENENIYIGIVRDITERKRIDKMKNEFISTVSHELRTPLTSIRGALGLINGGTFGPIPQQADEMLKIASNNTEKLLFLINDILDIQKIESGNIAFRFGNLELTPFIKQAIIDNAAYGAQYNISFVLQQTVDNCFVYADRDRLMQVISNLMSNAAKFSPPGGNVEITTAKHNDIIRISITDHGPGIPEDFQPKLFEKFTQSDSSDTRHKEGTGLGLSITKSIIEKHGGRIGFISKLNIGSTFYVDLPLSNNITLTNDNQEPTHLETTHKSCILIVEDDHDVAALIQRMLAESGYECDIAYTALQAKNLLEKNGDQYRLMTLDISLPDEDGINLLIELRQQSQYRNLPVVMISAKADEAKHTIEAGVLEVVDWLNKPIDQKRLVDVIKHAARKCSVIQVLHVEDEDDVHSIISAMLKDQCRLDRASTYTEAMHKITHYKYDLILLDIGLPDGSGLDLIDTIKNCIHPPQVIIFSAQDVTPEYAKQVNSVLVKSRTTNQKLLDIIKDIIE